jgi:ubiquinone/menaquinone biosynthesis C-methylase UbiE
VVQPAFADRWLTAFEDVYERQPLQDITWFTATAGQELVTLVRDGAIQRGDQVVELGCGPGVESLFLAVHGMHVTGVDRSPAALAIGKRLQEIYGVEVKWVEGDIIDVPLPDGCADVVSDSFIFHNVRPSKRDRYASEVNRLLRPGGLFVLRGYSDWMSDGTGPYRLSSGEILGTFLPYLECESLRRFRGLPTAKRPDQWHWMATFKRPERTTGETRSHLPRASTVETSSPRPRTRALSSPGRNRAGGV